MSNQSPVINLFSSDGYELSVINGNSTPLNTRGLLVAGSDGTNTRFILMDGSSRQVIVGAGTAGLPSGGILSIQGVENSTPISTNNIGKISTNNSTTTNLLANQTYTGNWEDCLNYSIVTISAYSDVNSLSNGWQIQWSGDGISLDSFENLTLLANVGRSLTLNVRARYFRTVYTNNSLAQTIFRINTILHQSGTGLNNYPINKTITDTSMSTLTRSVIVGQTTGGGGGYINVKVNPSGSLTADVSGSSVTVSGSVSGTCTAGAPATGVITVQGIASGTPLIAGATYNSSGITLTDGSTGSLQSDIKGNLKVTLATTISGEDTTNNVLAVAFQPLSTNTHAMTYVDGINVTGVIAKAAPGNLYKFWGVNGNASTRYIQVFNATSAPADGAIPLLAPIPVASGASFLLDLAPYARYFSTGIYICNSTTMVTKTLGSADMSITVGVG